MWNVRVGALALVVMFWCAGWPTDASAAPFLYVANENLDSGTVSVFDTATNTVTKTIAVANSPNTIAMHPSGTRFYVSGDNVSVVDTATNTVTGTIVVDGFPHSVAVHPSQARIYVAALSSNFASTFVLVIDTTTNTVLAKVPVAGASNIAVHPAGTQVYVAGGNTLSVIDTATNTVTATVAVSNIGSVVVHPAGVRVYATGLFKGSVAVIDTATNTVTATVPVGSYPDRMAVHPAGTRLYVADAAGDTVRVIDTVTNTVTATITVRVRPSPGTIIFNADAGIVVDPGGARLYVTNSTPGIGSLSVIDTATNAMTVTVPLNLASGRVITGTLTPSQISFSVAQGVAPGALGVSPPSTIMATGVGVNQTTFAVGQTLNASGGVTNPGLTGSGDFYVGILRPDNTIQFFTNSGIVVGRLADVRSFRPLATGVPLDTRFSVTVPNFYSHQRTASDQSGGHVFFLLAVKADALSDGTVTSDEVLGLATAPFSFP